MTERTERYSRQMILPGWGQEGQERLAERTAVVVGCGALGSHIAAHLVRAGIGRLVLADRDFVEWHNLPRQALYDEEDAAADEATDGAPRGVGALTVFLLIAVLLRDFGHVADAVACAQTIHLHLQCCAIDHKRANRTANGVGREVIAGIQDLGGFTADVHTELITTQRMLR